MNLALKGDGNNLGLLQIIDDYGLTQAGKLANFYVRNGRASESAVPLRKVIRSAAIPNAQVFALTASAGLEPSTVIQDLLPPDSSVFFDYLNFQTDRTNIDAAQQTWDHLLLLKSPFTISQTFQYLDALIKLREVNRATQVWLTLASRFPAQISVPPSRDNLLTNGNFHADILNGGFDWRVNPVVGALVTQEYVDLAPNLRALRIDFDGSENLFFNSALQFAPVQPDKEYSFSATLRSDRITTDSGVGVQITEAYGAGKVVGATDKLVGSSPWAEQRFTFRTGPNTRLLVVSIVRTPSAKFDSKIAGTFWLTRAALVAASP